MPQLALFGDSIARAQHDGTTTRAKGVATGLAILSRGALVAPPELNFAVSGADAAQTRAQAEGAATAIAANRVEIGLIVAGTNDLGGSRSAVEIAGDLAHTAALVASAGARPIVATILPRSKSMTTGTHALRAAVNQELRGLAQAGLFDLLDLDATFAGPDATGALEPLDGMTKDGLHPTDRGGWAISRALHELLGRARYDPRVDEADNFLENAGFTGHSGALSGLSGITPEGWGARVTGGAGGFCAVRREAANANAISIGFRPQETPVGQGEMSLYQAFKPATDGRHAGLRLRAGIEVKARDLAGISGVELYVKVENAGSTETFLANRPDPTASGPQRMDGMIELDSVVVRPDTQLVRFIARARIFGAMPVAGRIDFTRPYLTEE